MSKEQQRYFNFPIVLLVGFLEDEKKVLNDILNYSLYAHALKYEDKDGFDWTSNESEEKVIQLTESYFKITYGNRLKAYQDGKILFESVPLKTPKTGISKDVLFDYYENDKTDFEKVCLLIFLSIKSVLGKKAYCKTNKQFLFNRASGNDKAILKLEEIKDPLFKYANSRRIWDKISLELQMNWGLKYFSNRDFGFYVSFMVDETQFYAIVMTKKKSLQEKQFKEDKKAKIENAKRILEQNK